MLIKTKNSDFKILDTFGIDKKISKSGRSVQKTRLGWVKKLAAIKKNSKSEFGQST